MLLTLTCGVCLKKFPFFFVSEHVKKKKKTKYYKCVLHLKKEIIRL
ncbi:hypothetical protein JCM19301_75 [Jejuia pallidilutea]|uniref:Uncharacterized protein n=1 Tax=Jejuia pallidilutea TaxID=504487 RepID=A0A090WLU4_9FLAO|nr:hypothetical protein JCM19301_75 [Jejuia pallidilutea]